MSQVLTNDQKKAFDEIIAFLCDPTAPFFVVEGYAGTGKTFMMREVIREWGRIQNAITMVCPQHNILDMVFTATTNKAAGELARSTGWKTRTIHSALGLTISFSNGKQILKERLNHDPIRNSVIIVDECSYLDDDVIKKLLSRTVNCKFIFLGDPAQLVPVGYEHAPIFTKGLPTVRMTEVRRNSGHILDLATKFRDTVETGVFPQFKPDGEEVIWLPRPDFGKAIDQEFGRKLWNYEYSKVLVWRNTKAVEYGDYIRTVVSGETEMRSGDFVSNNSYVMHATRKSVLKTDELVYLQDIGPDDTLFDTLGNWVKINNLYWFKPKHPSDFGKAQARAFKLLDPQVKNKWLREIETWVDLRALTSQTVNKSQGSTYKQVFIDLDDIKHCPSANQIARMLYVGTSRASQKVIFTGDLV